MYKLCILLVFISNYTAIHGAQYIEMRTFVFLLGATAQRGQDFLIPEVSRSHTTTHRLKKDRHPCPWRDSIPQSQQAIGRKPSH
jgi:hypothetical protein